MRVLLILLLGVLGACQSAPIAMDLGSPVVSNAQGAAREGVVPLRGVSRVSSVSYTHLTLPTTPYV